MSDITQLLKKSEIAFPRPLGLEDTIRLFERLAYKLKAEVNYTKETCHRIEVRGQEYLGCAAAVRSDGELKISGTIYIPEYNHRTDSFSCPTVFIDDEEESLVYYKVRGISFFTTPGYELEELPEDSIKLMDAVRTEVNRYFNPQRGIINLYK
jgi:hypothetical protein